MTKQRKGNYFDLFKELESEGYEYHHTSWKRGYVSRKSDVVTAKCYIGHFGEGYTIDRPSWDSTQYCYIDYFVKQ